LRNAFCMVDRLVFRMDVWKVKVVLKVAGHILSRF
jgi:hypothetical protein